MADALGYETPQWWRPPAGQNQVLPGESIGALAPSTGVIAEKPAPAPVPTYAPAQVASAPPQTAMPAATAPASAQPAAYNAGGMQGPGVLTVGDNSLVSSQLQKLLEKDSPYLQLARARAAEASNARGLLNSSIAAGAGVLAATDAALPIAQNDAATYGRTDLANFDAANQFARDANQMGFQSAENAANRAFQSSRDAAQYANEQSMAQFNANERMRQMQFDAQNQSARDAAQFQFQAQRDAASAANDLSRIQYQTDQALRVYDAQNTTNLAAAYRADSKALLNDYQVDARRIQESDMDAGVKQAQLNELRSSYVTRSTLTNSLYRSAPAWNSEWAQFAVDFPQYTAQAGGQGG